MGGLVQVQSYYLRTNYSKSHYKYSKSHSLTSITLTQHLLKQQQEDNVAWKQVSITGPIILACKCIFKVKGIIEREDAFINIASKQHITTKAVIISPILSLTIKIPFINPILIQPTANSLRLDHKIELKLQKTFIRLRKQHQKAIYLIRKTTKYH